MSKNIQPVAVNCNEIAQIYADQNDGFISKDLLEALKLVDEAGLNSGNPLSELLLVSDKEVDYGSKGSIISTEGDLVLMLRVKAGDQNAFLQLLEAHKRILGSYAYLISSNNSKIEFEDAEVIVQLSYMECISKTNIVSNGKLCKSISKKYLDGMINKNLCEESTSVLSSDRNAKIACNAVKRAMTINSIEIQDLTLEMVKDLTPAQYKTGHNHIPADGIYNMLLSRDNVSYEVMTDETTDDDNFKSNAIIGQLSVSSHEDEFCDREEMNELMETVLSLSDEVCVMVFTDFHTQPKNTVSYKELAKKYGIPQNEIKAVMLRAQRRLQNAIKKSNPDLYKREMDLRAK